jgi:hypothetical protein
VRLDETPVTDADLAVGPTGIRFDVAAKKIVTLRVEFGRPS